MKKALSLILILAIALAFTACEKDASDIYEENNAHIDAARDAADAAENRGMPEENNAADAAREAARADAARDAANAVENREFIEP